MNSLLFLPRFVFPHPNLMPLIVTSSVIIKIYIYILTIVVPDSYCSLNDFLSYRDRYERDSTLKVLFVSIQRS